MKAIFLILFAFASFVIFLGYTANNSSSSALGNALIFGGVAIYIGMITVWILFKIKEKQDSE